MFKGESMSAELLYQDLTYRIIGAAMEVHRELGPGFLESIYQRALAQELTARHVVYEAEQRISVVYKGVIVGDFDVDLLVEGLVIVELKAVAQLNQAHHAQVINYLTASQLELALLINFGEPSLRHKRIIRQPNRQSA